MQEQIVKQVWVKQTLDMICHNNKFRSWLEIPVNGTLDILLQAKSKFYLNIIDISTKHTQCCDIRSVHNDTSKDTSIQYDRHLSAKEALKEIFGYPII